MKSPILLMAAASALACTASVAAAPQRAHPAAAAAATVSDSQRLAKLFHDSDEATLRRNPIQALFG
jgi:hypothetical protein